MPPRRGAIPERLATFHSRTVPSSPPLARVVPSGLNATEYDQVGVAGERVADRPAGGHVPQPHRAILAAAGQGRAVRAERHREDRAGVAGERAADLPAGGHVPQPHRAVVAAAGQGRAVRAERHRVHLAGVAGERAADRRRVATSHSRTAPLESPLARVLPSGLNATAVTTSLAVGQR